MATTRRPRRTTGAARARLKLKPLLLTASYVKEGRWYTGEILEATGVYTQSRSLAGARANMMELLPVMIEEAPHQFGGRGRKRAPRGAITEPVLVLLPR